jgi:peptidoglycan/LPS O-acetylase OafA/YrhL
VTVPTPHLSHPKYRPDIDGLRAVAVLAVVAFHAFPNWVSGGFIGVDVFFVISGYLISTILFENLDKGAFGFAEFYSRRIRRIFPALTLVLVACFAFGWFALLPDEYKQLGKYIAAGAGFVSNLALWSDAGYFDNSGETKPLLHLWSLGIEEQFYIIWPVLLWFAWKRKFNLLTITVLVALISLILNIKGIKNNAVATFYSPQTRFWELLSGSLLAWLTLYKFNAHQSAKLKVDGWLAAIISSGKTENNGSTLANVISAFGFMLLAYGFWRITKDSAFPGKWALIPVSSSVLIIAAGPKAWLNRHILSRKIAVWFGLISFPLYLWHWPLLSYARIVENETPSREARIGLVIVSIALAWFTYRFIERPIRLGGHNMIKNCVLALLTLTIGCIGFITFERNGLSFRFPRIVQELTTYTYDYKYAYREGSCFLRPEQSHTEFDKCANESPNNQSLLLWGDSHAAHLYPGFKARYEVSSSVIQRTASGCPPILNIDIPTRLHCKSINDSILKLIQSKKPNVVIMAANWPSYDISTLENTVNTIRALGVSKIVIVGPVPQWKDGLPKQLFKHFSNYFPHTIPQRMTTGLMTNTSNSEESLDVFSKKKNLHYISAIQIMCNEQGCITKMGETGESLTTWDYGHLTSIGSIFMVSRFPNF